MRQKSTAFRRNSLQRKASLEKEKKRKKKLSEKQDKAHAQKRQTARAKLANFPPTFSECVLVRSSAPFSFPHSTSSALVPSSFILRALPTSSYEPRLSLPILSVVLFLFLSLFLSPPPTPLERSTDFPFSCRRLSNTRLSTDSTTEMGNKSPASGPSDETKFLLLNRALTVSASLCSSSSVSYTGPAPLL